MTTQHIDSKSRKFDRRSALKGAAMLPALAIPFIPGVAVAGKNDAAIVQAVADYVRLSNAAFADGVPEDETYRLNALAEKAARVLLDLPSDSAVGIREKLRWIRLDENFNDGSLDPGYLNGDVLLSLFDDIERLV